VSIQLRDYQAAAHVHLREQWAAGRTRVPMVLATGLGKTEIFTHADLLSPFLDDGLRVLIIAHTDELIMQAAAKARRNNPGRRVGIVKGQEHNDTTAQIIVSSRQTLQTERRRNSIRRVGLIIVDEAHHAVRTNTYGKILEYFGAYCPPHGCVDPDNELCPHIRPMVAGFTATLARGDTAKLSTVWEDPAPGTRLFTRDILFGIRRGYLLDVTAHKIVIPDLDMRNVRVVGGDYQDRGVADELERTAAPEVVAKEYKRLAAGRKGIGFWPLVETAEHAAEAFNAEGIRSEVIHGDISRLPKRTRRAMLQRLHTGETQMIHGVGVLTEGFDEPTVDVVVIGRPTKSAPLYQQMVGRVLRPDLTVPAAERGKALILDVVGAGVRHDLRSLIDLSPELAGTDLDAEDGESLLEMQDEWEQLREEQAGQDRLEPELHRGPVETQEFDPLNRMSAWSQTRDGIWFMSAGSVAYAFLVESVTGDPAHWDVVLCSKPARGIAPWARATEYMDLPMEEALGWAEEVAVEVGGYGAKALSGRKSAWRKAEPTPAQVGMARSLGISTEGMTKGEVSQAIDAVKASQRIDPMVKMVRSAVIDS
jgi:superfamily II DNA or RNA helicase